MASWKDIASEVCLARGVTRKEVFSPMRHPHIARARWEIMSRIRNETKLSYRQIGSYMGRNHFSVLYGVRRWEEIRGE